MGPMGQTMIHPFLMGCDNSSNFSENVSDKIFNKEWHNRVFFVVNTFQINCNNDIVIASDITWHFWNFGCNSDCWRITFWWRHNRWKVNQGCNKWSGDIDWDIEITEIIGLIGSCLFVIGLFWNDIFEMGLIWKTYKRPRSGQTNGQFFLEAIFENPFDSISGHIGLKKSRFKIRTFIWRLTFWGL